MNKGERDELIFKILLAQRRDVGGELFGVKVSSVGFGYGNDFVEFGHIPEDFELSSLKVMSANDLLELAANMNIKKASGSAKSDIYINKVGVSLKSLRASPPALVNHTMRHGFEFACREKNISIEELDEMIDEYWDLRLKGIIKEDTKIVDVNCPFKKHKKYLKPILEYFLFTGTGSRVSDYPATYLIEFIDPFDISTYKKIYPFDAIEECWERLIFSVRSKGMPDNYNPNTYNAVNSQSISKWVRFVDGKYKGALHIRQKKAK